jgi:hypothetical protein
MRCHCPFEASHQRFIELAGISAMAFKRGLLVCKFHSHDPFRRAKAASLRKTSILSVAVHGTAMHIEPQQRAQEYCFSAWAHPDGVRAWAPRPFKASNEGLSACNMDGFFVPKVVVIALIAMQSQSIFYITVGNFHAIHHHSRPR